MHARTGRLADDVQAGQHVGLRVEIDLDPAHKIVLDGYDRDQFFCNVDPPLQAGLVNGREPVFDEVGALCS